MGKLKAIWVKRAKQGPMDPKEEVELISDHGIKDNANVGGRRQVTIIEEEVWQSLMQELDGDLPPWRRRANLMVRDFSLKDARGKILRIGDCLILIKGETKPCNQMDEALEGLQKAMFPDWKGGAFGQVIEGGKISVGDDVSWESE